MEHVNVSTKSEIPKVFLDSNIYLHKTKIPHEHVWERLLPSTFSPSSFGENASVIFTDIDVGVSELIRKSNLFPTEDSIEYYDTVEYLKECFQQFVSLSPNKKYSVKIEPTRGQKGKKCPKWHANYVPLRLILALHGPGVNYASLTSNEYKKYWKACNRLGSDRANGIMEKESSDKIQRFDTGDCVILMGKKWQNCCNAAAIHRSPDVRPFQGRVLMTIDVDED